MTTLDEAVTEVGAETLAAAEAITDALVQLRDSFHITDPTIVEVAVYVALGDRFLPGLAHAVERDDLVVTNRRVHLNTWRDDPR